MDDMPIRSRGTAPLTPPSTPSAPANGAPANSGQAGPGPNAPPAGNFGQDTGLGAPTRRGTVPLPALPGGGPKGNGGNGADQQQQIDAAKASNQAAGAANKIKDAVANNGNNNQGGSPNEPTAPSTTANVLGVAGGVVGAVAVSGNVQRAGQGVNEIANGNVKDGAKDLLMGGGGALVNVGQMSKGVVAASNLTGIATDSATVSKLAGASEVLGKIGGPLTIASGGLQTVAALSKNPPDMKGAVTGGLTVAAGALMLCPPPADVAGGVLAAGVAIYQNWGTISKDAGKVANAVEDGAKKTVEAAEDLGKKATHAMANAGKKIASFFGF